MASPQKKCVWGHIMAGFDQNHWCQSCREKGVGQDLCVIGKPDCQPCSLLMPEQRDQLSRHPYRERKARKLALHTSEAVSGNESEFSVVSSAAVSTSRGRKRDRSGDSRLSKRSRSPEPEREFDRVCMDRFETTLSLMKDTLLKMQARDAAREFRPVSTEVVGSILVETSSQPFFQAEKAVGDSRHDRPVPAGVGRRQQSIPSAAARSADQLAGDGVGTQSVDDGAGVGSTNPPYYAGEQFAGDGAGWNHWRDSSLADSEVYLFKKQPSRKSGTRRVSTGLQLPDDRETDFYLLSDPERLVRLKDLPRLPLEVVARARSIYLDEDHGAPQSDDSTPHRPSSKQQHRPRYQ